MSPVLKKVLLFLPSTLVTLFCLFSPFHASAATDIFYSVGQNTSDHKTGSPTISISGTTGTFSVAQTATNMGIGDVVTYGGNRVFITGKTSTLVWSVATATGTAPVATTTASVTSIAHAFASLNAAVGGGATSATSSSFLNSSNLVSGNYTLNIPCYYDSGSDTTTIFINNGYVTGASNYLNIFTATSTVTQVNQSQRHVGVWNTSSAYNIFVTGSTLPVLKYAVNYIKIDGLQISSDTGHGIEDGTYPTPGTGAGSAYISNNIIMTRGSKYGIQIFDSSPTTPAYIWNNIIFFNSNSGHSTSNAITTNPYSQTIYIYNNTIYNFTIGIARIAGNILAKNNLIASSTSAASSTFLAGTDYNTTDRSTMSYTVTGGGNTHDRLSQTFSFVSVAGGDFHLTSGDAGAKDFGVNLSADGNLPFSVDIDGNVRPQGSAWDMGADEYKDPVSPSATTTSASSITTTTATLNGSITDTGGVNATQSGFAYGTSASLSTVIATTTLGAQSGTASFSSAVSSLTCGTTYYSRAYATNTAGTGYGTIVSFSTLSCTGPATISTLAASSLASSTATLNGVIVATNGSDATQSGFAYGTSASLSTVIATTTLGAQSGTASFSSAVSSLTCGTTYYSRAYVTNASGTSYGSTVSFLPPCPAPIISSISTSVSSTTATITWTTDQNSTSTVSYGYTASYGSASTSASSVTSHSIILTGLLPTATYHFQISSGNTSNNYGTSSDVTFTTAYGTARYIRAGASGANNGSSWANAWPNFASVTWNRGDIYYVAGGTYNENILLLKAQSGNSWVTIKKANATDNSADVGWSSTYEATVATINGSVDLGNGYVALDGVTGSGQSGHGIRIHNSSYSDVLFLEPNLGAYSIKHVEIEGAGVAATTTAYSGVKLYNYATPQSANYFGYNWIHQTTTNGVIFGGMVGTTYNDYGLLFENNVISETGLCLDVDNHGQGMQLGLSSDMGYVVIRNNLYSNIAGSGMIVWLGGTGVGTSADHHDIQIYNNLFRITDTVNYTVISPGVMWAEAQRNGSGGVFLTNLTFANNTIYNVTGGSNLAQIFLEATTTGIVVKNNIWENSKITGAGHYGINTQLNNAYYNNTGSGVPTSTPGQINGSASTFVNAGLGDFTLIPGGYAVDAGVNLSSIFSVDRIGTSRPQGSAWDVGAYEYAVDSSAPVISSVASSTSSTAATITWTTDESSTSTVSYGATSSYGSASTSASLVTSHSITLTGLSSGTLYHLRVASQDVSGNVATSSDYTFTTSAVGPTLTTSAASSITTTTATLNGSITATGGANATQSGFAYGTASDLATVIATTTLGAQVGTASFTSSVTSLTCNTTYYSRAYATNSAGTGLGSIVSFTTSACAPTVTTVTTSTSAAGGSSARRQANILRMTQQTTNTSSHTPTISSFIETLISSGIIPPHKVDIARTTILAPSSPSLFKRDLQLRDRGTDVASLQTLLISKGFLTVGNNTGNFGPQTFAAVKKYQTSLGLPATGYFGVMTRNR